MRHTNHHIFLNKTTILNVTKEKLALHGHATQCAVNEWQSMQYLTESSPLYTNNTIEDVSWYLILIETHTFLKNGENIFSIWCIQLAIYTKMALSKHNSSISNWHGYTTASHHALEM